MTDAPAGAVPPGKVPVVVVVVASWKFLGDNFRLLLPAALVIGVVSGVAPVLMSAGKPMTQGVLFMASIVQMACNALFSALVLRKAVRGEFNAPVGLSFGQDESRLIGVMLCIGLLLMPLLFVFGVTFVSIAIGQAGLTEADITAMEGDPTAATKVMTDAFTSPAGIMLCLVGVAVFLLLYARLCMVNAATIGEKKMVFLQTWGWSKGNVLRVVGATLMTWLPALVANMLLVEVLDGIAGPTGGPLAAGLLGIVLSFIATLGSVPFTVLGAELYRGLRPPGFVAK